MNNKMSLGFWPMLVVVLPCLASAVAAGLGQHSSSADSVLRFMGGEKTRQTIVSDQLASPAFCNKLDCPHFTVLEKKSTYELREYVASQWVSTTSVGVDYDQAQHQDFMRLFRYISGSNTKGQKIAMTAPVLNSIIPGPGPACANNFTMSFFVSPKEGQPPQPSDPEVALTSLPKLRVYVRSFGGFASKDKWLEEAVTLSKDLGSSVSYVKDYYYTAGYNSPFQLFNRHNEIWFIAQ